MKEVLYMATAETEKTNSKESIVDGMEVPEGFIWGPYTRSSFCTERLSDGRRVFRVRTSDGKEPKVRRDSDFDLLG